MTTAAGYDAFISYSHAADGALAPALQNALQGFAKPWWRRRALHVFRDQTSLAAASGLWSTIEGALHRARFLLLLASPEAAASSPVQHEVEWWLEHRSPETLVLALTDGRLVWDPATRAYDPSQTTALPPKLLGAFREEPLWVDLRWAKERGDVSPKDPRFQNVVATIAAPLRGMSKEDLIGEDVRQHRRALLLARGAVLTLVLLLLVAITAAVVAVEQRNAAKEAQIRAEREAAISRSRQLAAEASVVRASAPALALLLSVEAMKQADTVEARGGLLAGLASDLHLVAFLPGHTSRVRSLAFSPDGRMVASGAADGTIAMWNIAGSQPTGTITSGHAGIPPIQGTPVGRPASHEIRSAIKWNDPAVTDLVFSPDGAKLVSGGCGWLNEVASCDLNMIALWDVATGRQVGQPLRDWTLTRGPVGVAFSPDGAPLVSAGSGADLPVWDRVSDHTGFHVWDAASDHPIGQPFQPPLFRSPSSPISPNGLTWALGGPYGTVTLLDIASGEKRAELRADGMDEVRAVAFNAKGTLLAAGGGASGGFGGAVALWDLATGEQIITDIAGNGWQNDEVESLAFSPDSLTLESADRRGTVQFWNTKQGVRIGDPFVGTVANVGDVALSPDGRTLAVGDWDGNVILWDITALRPPAYPVVQRSDYAIPSLAFSPNSERLAYTGCGKRDDQAPQTGGEDRGELLPGPSNQCIQGEVRLWDIQAGKQVGPTLLGHLGAPTGAAFSPDGAKLATSGCGALDQFKACDHRGEVRLWDVGAGGQGSRLLADDASAGSQVAFISNGATLAYSGLDGSLVLVDVATGKEVRRLSIDAGPTFSPNGKLFASSTIDNAVVLWDVATGEQVGLLRTGHTDRINDIAFSPDGSLLATASLDGTVELWDVATRQQVGPPLPGYTETPFSVESVAFSPDGRTLAWGGWVRTSELGVIVLWDIASGSRLGAILPGGRGMQRIAFSPNGRVLASGDFSGSVVIWDVDAASWTRLACARANRNLYPLEWTRYFGSEPYHPTCPDLPWPDRRISPTPSEPARMSRDST